MDQSRLKLIGGIIVASMTPLSAMLGTAAAATGRITTLAVVAALALGVVNLGNFLQGFFDTSSGRKQVAEENLFRRNALAPGQVLRQPFHRV